MTDATDVEADGPSDSGEAPPAPTDVPPTVATENNDTAPMDIGAYGPNGHEIGAQFTVTTEDGAFLGSCTLEGNGDEPFPLSCRVDVPRYTTVVVMLDESTITPGYAPVENPIISTRHPSQEPRPTGVSPSSSKRKVARPSVSSLPLPSIRPALRARSILP